MSAADPAVPSPSIDRILLVPRWAGRRDSDFYPWLIRSLPVHGWRGDVEIVSLRPPDPPDLAATVSAVRGRLSVPALASRTLVVAHSVGAQAALRALASLPDGVTIPAILLVAAWWSIDRPWPSIQPWIDTPFDSSRARAAASRRVVLLSDNDPFTADFAQTRRDFETRLAADVRVHPGAAHFNAPEQPLVLSAALPLLGLP